ncbi:MAG: hypothetical protein NTX22_03105 [Ignavibacteriales bacterium]|nr:hypothetical protein [Ignavibacteriales bacterium]
MMTAYLLFTSKNDELMCNYIFAEEEIKLFSFSLEEEFIVKAEETKYKTVKELEASYSAKSKTAKSKKQRSVIVRKEYQDIRQALYFLGSSMDDFKEGIPAHKKLPQIVNPYDMDFEEVDDDFDPIKSNLNDEEFNEDKLLDGLKDFQDDDEEKNFDDLDDDEYFR